MSSTKGVSLIGAGTQGTRLAYMWSKLGNPVHLVDQNEERLKQSVLEIQKLRQDRASEKGGKEWGEIITHPSSQLQESLSESWLVVECVPESLALKKKLVKQLDELAQPDLIVASNSSSYTISEIIENLELKHPERCISLHSYWPPETSGLFYALAFSMMFDADIFGVAIEVMGSEQTRPEIIPLLIEACRNHGFQPFHVRQTSTGYIYNRIWAAIKREALLVVSEGVATPEEVDAIFKDVLKSPKGPCEQMDVVGLDVVRDIEKHYQEVRQGLPTETTTLLEKMIAEGKLGVKSGYGFYEYKNGA